MTRAETDIDEVRAAAHLQGFKKGYARAIQSLMEPLAVVEGWIDPTAMSVKDEIRSKGGRVDVVAPMVLAEPGKYYTRPVTVTITARSPDDS